MKSGNMKTPRQILTLLTLLVFAATIVAAQTSGDYRSAASGNWGTVATWEKFDGSSWLPALRFLPVLLHMQTLLFVPATWSLWKQIPSTARISQSRVEEDYTTTLRPRKE
jgi:hypothetical protein